MSTTVCRVEKTRDFTVMSNHHLRHKGLSLKAKGLLSLMLSLPEEWDYSIEGLSTICTEGITAVRSGIKELEAFGYIKREIVRNEKGQYEETDYIIREFPVEVANNPEKPKKSKEQKKKSKAKSATPASEQPTFDELPPENPTSDCPISENLTSDNLASENQRQLNTNKLNKYKLNTDCIKYPSINNTQLEESVTTEKDLEPSERWIDRYNKTISAIKKQISYDDLIVSNNAELINDIVSVMTEVFLVDTPYYTIENKKIPAELVRINYRKITYSRLDTFLLDFSRMYDRIKNPKNYLIAALYNIASTAETSITNRVNHDMYGYE